MRTTKPRTPRRRPDGTVREWLSKEEVADELGLSVRHVERSLSSGKLKKTKFGQLVRIHISDLNAYIQASRD